MTCDLKKIFGDLAQLVPTETDGNHKIVLSAQNLPLPPTKMETNQIFIRKVHHDYHIGHSNNKSSIYRTDALWIEMNKATCRYLGLLILAIMFHLSLTMFTLD